MARRCRSDLDDVLESWARWCARVFIGSGPMALGGGQMSLIAKLMACGGQLTGSTGGRAVQLETVELRVEGCVWRLAQLDVTTADVLRLEYDAGWHVVCERRGIRRYDPAQAQQRHKAQALGISLRTYHNKLKQARAAITEDLKLA